MDRIGRYEIREPLGAGSMGRVYRAYDTVLEREVALKTIRAGMDSAPEIRQRFQREARACARLRHPHIITVYDLGEAEDLAYIAMELLHGADFRRLIQERREVALDTKIEAAAQVCEALAYAHREGLIHRDIKPSNLFLTDDGSAKVLDFGIARLPASDLTMRGQVLGTPRYMAPEQIQGRPSDGRADLFSVAVVLFELLTGAHPFQSEMAPQRIVQGAPDGLLAKDPSLPVALERVIARGLEKDPQQRYLTGDEFAKDLRAILDSFPQRASQAAVAPTPAPPAAQATPLAVECPPGEDPEEWRLAEALRLLPEFETAVERRDIPAAQAMLSQLEARLGGDIRFAEALRLCRSRLPLPFASPPEVGKAAMAVETPPAEARPALPHEGGVDATIFGRAPVRSEEARPAVGPSGPPLVPAPAAMAAAPARPAPPREAPSPAIQQRPAVAPRPAVQPAPRAAEPGTAGRGRKAILIGGVVVCGAVLAVGAIWYLQPPPVEPAVATAAIGPGGSNIYSNPSAGESVVASLAAGAHVNVLNLPVQRGQEWIRVQAVKPEVLRPGYIRTSALRDWQAPTAAGALAVARLLGAGTSGTIEEIEAQADRLSNIGRRYGSEPEARQARLEAARLRLAAARREKDAGQPAAEWTAHLRKAQDDLENLGGDPQVREAAADLNQQVAAMLSAVKAR